MTITAISAAATASVVKWALPTAGEVYEEREQIRSAWKTVTTALSGRKSTIAVTGSSGAGKTALLDFLRGKAYRRGYKGPDPSFQTESGSYKVTGKKIVLTTIPGESSAEKTEGFQRLFEKDPVDGVIHVVANAYLTPRNAFAALALQTDSLSNGAVRDQKRQRELHDLRDVCGEIRKAAARKRGRKNSAMWLFVAVTKLDLYYHDKDELNDAVAYYTGNSEFTRLLEQLRGQIGSDYFSYQVLPVATVLDDFSDEAGVVRRSEFRERERDHYVARFANELARRCGGR